MYTNYLHSFNKHNFTVTFHLSSFILTKPLILVDEQLFLLQRKPSENFHERNFFKTS